MKLDDINSLADDPTALKSLLIEQLETIKRKDQTISSLQEQINLLLHQRFGKSSERYSPDQLGLFNEAEAIAAETEESLDETITIGSHQRAKRGRRPLPESLPRVEVIHDLSEAEKICPHDGHPLHRIGEAVLEQLEIIPAKVQVIRNIRPKYACRLCETGVHTAPLPPSPIPKSMATAGLLAYIAINKYVDAMPLYRQEKAFERIGVELKRSTLALWMIRVGELLQPILEALNRDLLLAPYLHMDETRIQVLHADGKSYQGLSQMWVRCSGECHQPIVLFDYDRTRSGSVPLRLLNGYSGYLVSDAYAGYNAILKDPNIQGVGCWAHARRKFDEAIKAQQSKTDKAGKARQGISYIQHLYRIERTIQDKPPDERLRVRRQEARPVLDKIRVWVSQSLGEVPPASKLGKAIQYLHEEWDRLVVYIEDGRLPIDNNRCENAIRPFVVGRRNWLFSDTDKGARASAAIYSVIESAKANGLDPYQYLRVLLTELPAIEGQSVDHLLPYSLDLSFLPSA